MPQYQPPVTPVTTTRNTVAPGATTSRNNGPLCNRGVVAPGGPAQSSSYTGQALPLVNPLSVENEFNRMQLTTADAKYLTAPREQPSPCPWCGGRLVHHPACDDLRFAWQMVMQSGRYKGKRLAEIPRDYLEWLARVASVDADLKVAARRQLEASQQ